MNVLDRFWDKVDDSGECWVWTAYRTDRGYGKFQPYYRTPTVYAHRFAYEITVGPIPKHLEIDHLCGNPSCVRPSHLEPVTHLENVRRGRSGQHNKLKTHCAQGHPFDAANTVMNDRGWRACRICRRASVRRANAKRRSKS